MKRMQRLHMMQRSSSSRMRGPISTFFGFFTFMSDEARNAAAVLDGLFLEAAFAGLVADRAIERVIDEQELHHALAAFLDEFAGGADAHVFGDRVGAGDHRARHPADRLVAVLVVLGFLAGASGGVACPSGRGTCGSFRAS